MPRACIQVCNVDVPLEKQKEIVSNAITLLSEITKKPKQYCMSTIIAGVGAMGSSDGPLASLNISGIGGLTPAVNKILSKEFGNLLNRVLGIPPDRVYIVFSDIQGSNWGWNGGTF